MLIQAPSCASPPKPARLQQPRFVDRYNRVKAYVSELLRLPSHARRASIRPALLVLAASLAVTLSAAWLTRLDDISAGRARFEALADKITASVAETMDAYEQVLQGGVGLFNAFGDVSRSAWATYVASLRLQDTYPGIQGVGYAAVVDPQSIDNLVTAVRSEGFPEFNVHPPGLRELVTAILYLEPMDWRNRRALGYDMFSEPSRRIAMIRARDTGEASISQAVRLMQETDQDVQNGVLLYLPVYEQGSQTVTVEQRRKHLAGFVYSPFRMGDLLTRTISQSLGDVMGQFQLEVFDGPSTDGDRLMLRNPPAAQGNADHPSLYTVSQSLMIHGTPWTLRYASAPEFERTARSNRPLYVLQVGTVLGTLIAAVVGLLGLGRETARLAAQRLSDEVVVRQQAEEQARLATRELAHRVKNSLSIVSAIASQTVRYSSSLADFDGAFRGRLLGLSRVHDLLASGRTYATDIAVLAREVLQPYRGEQAERLKLDGPAATLAPNTAIMLSMVFNELATNATKYGAWSAPDGTVELTWSIADGDPGKMLALTWKERGGPPAAPPKHSGFGSNVIKFAIERSLRGTAVASFGEHGAIYEISIPATHLVEEEIEIAHSTKS